MKTTSYAHVSKLYTLCILKMNIKKKGKPYGNAQNVLYEIVLYIFRFLGSYCLVKFILYIQKYMKLC